MRKKLKSLDRRIHFIIKRDKPFNQYREVKHPVYGYKQTVPLCPVCGAEMKYTSDFMEHTMMEEHESCPNRCYSYSFVTGSEETCIGAITVHGYYADSQEDKEHHNRIINMAVLHERRKRREDNSRRGST